MIRAPCDMIMTPGCRGLSGDDRVHHRHVHHRHVRRHRCVRCRRRSGMCQIVHHPVARPFGDESHRVRHPCVDAGHARRPYEGEGHGRRAYAADDDPSHASRGRRPSRVRGGRHNRTSRSRDRSSRSGRSSNCGRRRCTGFAAHRLAPRCLAAREALAPVQEHRTSREIKSSLPRKSTGALVLLLPITIGAVAVPRYFRRSKR